MASSPRQGEEPPAGYRDPARSSQAAPTPPPPDGDAAATLASFAGLAGVGALAVGHLELLALAGAGAAAAAISAVRALSARRRQSSVARFLGTDAIVEGPGTWTTPDGTRRVRVVHGDALVRFERLDPSTGETLSSHRAPCAVAPIGRLREPAEDQDVRARSASSGAQPPRTSEGEVLASRVAQVFGRPRAPRCFLGLPPELGASRVIARDARWLLVIVRRDGVVLERRDADGELAGDTLHADEASARLQIAMEYGDRIGRFRDAEEARLVATEAPRAWDEPGATRLAL